ncbi:hypothetical protein KQI84_08535 [bacterium]|nr:hypothetical protein [bacterium]
MSFQKSHTPEDQSPATIEEHLEIECIRERILRADSYKDAYALINEQLNAIHMRATGVITIAGVVVTVTGFSGRTIAGTSLLAQILVVSGLLACVLAAAITMLYVTPVRWLTSYMHLDPEQWLLAAIRRRDKKTKAHRIAVIVLVIGLTLYGLSICQMLMFPFEHMIHEQQEVPVVQQD